jgi:hypothetical protein
VIGTEINFAMLAIIPALIGAGISIYFVQRLAMRFLRRKDRSKQWTEMRRHLRWLDLQLIRTMQLSKSSSSSSVVGGLMNGDMNESQLGFFLLRLRRLETLEYALPHDQRPLMRRDIGHLRSLEFDSHQKNLIISSMFRTYPLLSHDSIIALP